MNIEFFILLFSTCSMILGALIIFDWLLGLIIKLYNKIK